MSPQRRHSYRNQDDRSVQSSESSYLTVGDWYGGDSTIEVLPGPVGTPTGWRFYSDVPRYSYEREPAETMLSELTEAVRDLRTEIRKLREELRREADVRGEPPQVEPMSDQDARRLIEELMRRGGDLYPSDISEQLGIAYVQVVRVLEALESEGLIGRAS